MSKANPRQYKSGSVFQRKDGMWVGRFEAGTDRDGKRRRITVSATTEPRCKEKLEDRKAEVARDGVPERGSGTKLTVEAWSKQWLKIIVTELRPKPYATTRSCLKVWIVPTIGRKKLANLSPADLRAIYTKQRLAGIGQASQVRAHATLIKMLKDAVREGHHVPQSVLLTKRPKMGENDRVGPPLAQALKILGVVSKRDDASLWAMLLLQAPRQGERLGLTWSCVDFENQLLDISWQLQPLPYIDNRHKELGFRVPDGYMMKHLTRRFHLVRPKTAKGRRVIPMTPWMEASLRAWREVAPESEFDLVWPDKNGMPRDAAADLAEWKAIQEAAGVSHPTGRPYILHEARHATITLLRALKVPKDVIAAIVGQSKLIESYDHSDNIEEVREAMALLAEQLSLVAPSKAAIEA